MKIKDVTNSDRADGVSEDFNISAPEQIRTYVSNSSLPAIEELKSHRNWVGWLKKERRRNDGSTRTDKVPISPHNGKFASVSDSSTWGSFQQVEDCLDLHSPDGIGYVFTSDNNIVGVDIDNCVDSDGEIDPKALAIIKLLDSYTEWSPSGEGFHIWVKGEIPRSLINHEAGIEVYSVGRFFTFTGDHVAGTPTAIEERQDEIYEIYDRHSERNAVSVPVNDNQQSDVFFTVPSPEEIREALSYIPEQSDYGECWLPVQMAVHSVYPDDVGIRLIEEWSPGYEGEVAQKFASFSQVGNSNGRVKIGTLFHIAKQHGYVRRQRITRLDPVIDISGYRAEDGGILDAWEDFYGEDWLFSESIGLLLKWSSSHWSPDYNLEFQRLILNFIKQLNDSARSLLNAASTDEDEKIAKAYISATKRTRNRVNSVVEMAKALKAIEPSRLDQGNLLNLLNGTLDLDTLKFREHRRDDYLTHCLDFIYDPLAKCPRWEQFIGEVLVDATTGEPDAELSYLIQEGVGYTLTVSTKAETMFMLLGHGSNGKSVTTTIIKRLLGSLAIVTNFNRWGESGNYEIARLPGKRLVLSTESEPGGRVDEPTLRRIVSGEVIPARAIYGRPFEFKPVAKLWWAMNQKPTIRETGYATWRRLIIIPFNRTFTDLDRDPNLSDKLIAELPGILNWALTGLERFHLQGRFTKPRLAREAIEEYQREANPLLEWFNESVEIIDQRKTSASSLYRSYSGWCARAGVKHDNRTVLGRILKTLPGVKYKRSNGVKYNLRIKE